MGTDGSGRRRTGGAGRLVRAIVVVAAVVTVTACDWQDLVESTHPGSPPPTLPAEPPVDAPVQYRYEADDGSGGAFLSDRDCGWSTEVSGIDSTGRNVSRIIWGFCDSVGYHPESGRLWNPAGVPSNSYAISEPGRDPVHHPVTSPASIDHTGNPVLLAELIPGLDDSCPDPSVTHPREWIRSMVTLPDDEPSVETVAVFYQNFCIDFGSRFDFGAGGVAVVQWSADRPDAPLVRRRLSDRWFLPGPQVDVRSGAAYRSFTYGSGAVVDHSGTMLHVYSCGAGGDCTVARAPVSAARSGLANAWELADTGNWAYLDENLAWSPFPAPGSSGTCVPTVLDDCGGFPEPMVVADASAGDPLSIPSAEPSVKQVDGRVYLLYATGFDDGFAYRVADGPAGPFSAPRAIEFDDDRCRRGCRVPIWHPAADRQGRWAISYYDEHGLDGLVDVDRRAGRVMLAYIDPPPIDSDG